MMPARGTVTATMPAHAYGTAPAQYTIGGPRVVVQGMQGQPIRVVGGQPQPQPQPQPVRYVVAGAQQSAYPSSLKVSSQQAVAGLGGTVGGNVIYKVASQGNFMVKVASQQQAVYQGAQPGDAAALKVASQLKVGSQLMAVPSGAGQPLVQHRVVQPTRVVIAPQPPSGTLFPSGAVSPGAMVTTAQPGAYTYRPAGSGQVQMLPPTMTSSQHATSVTVPARASATLSEAGLVKKAEEILQDGNRAELKALVVQCFRESESVKRDPPEINLKELYAFKRIFMQKTGVPESLFKDLEIDYCRFDFSGTTMLTINETYKMIKFYLYSVLRKAGVAQSLAVPMISSLDSIGYRNLKEVGKGAQGTVYFCTNAEGVEKCVKSYKKETVSITGLAELREEFEAMKLCACDRVAAAFEIFHDNQFYYMVGECYHGGDFMTLKIRARAEQVDMNEVWWRGVFRQCLEGIQFMHQQAMMHCDIKEPNLMLRTNNFREPQVVIIDLGLSKATVGKARTGGTPGYIPPETLERNIWFPKGDVFSMGVSVIQIITDKMPPTGARTTATPGGIFVEGCRTVEDISHATRTRLPPFDKMPPEWPDLRKWTQRLLQKNFNVRPTAQQALEDPWFTKEKRARVGTGLTEWVNARNRFATDGITASVLVRIEDGDN